MANCNDFEFSIIIIIIIIFQYCIQHVISSSDSRPLAPALYVFGDSLFDSGNNNFLPTMARADFDPYGVNFTHGATGRFTNGRTIADFIAEYLGLPFPPPYMSFLLGELPLTGLNYASGSCGILSDTANYAGKCLNFDDQINMFQQTVEQRLPRQNLTSSEISDYLSKSIFLITIGSNDYINNYLLTNLYDSSRLYTPKSFATLLANTLSQKLELLFLLGGRKFLVYEIGPIGCIPSITRSHKHNGTCDEEINQFAILFNYQLAPMLQNLTTSLKGSAFTLGHSYWLAYDAIMNPANYGLTDSRNPCCTIWENGTWLCIPELSPCKDIDKHFFWDGYHLTEAAYTFLVKPCFNDTTVCIPLNMKELLTV